MHNDFKLEYHCLGREFRGAFNSWNIKSTHFLHLLLLSNRKTIHSTAQDIQPRNDAVTCVTNDFSLAIHIQVKLRLAVIPLLGIISQQMFAHATTVQLSYHIENFVAIMLLESRKEEDKNFQRICDGKSVSEMRSWLNIESHCGGSTMGCFWRIREGRG